MVKRYRSMKDPWLFSMHYYNKLYQKLSEGNIKRGYTCWYTQETSGILATARTWKPLAQSHICKAHCGYDLLLEVPFSKKVKIR